MLKKKSIIATMKTMNLKIKEGNYNGLGTTCKKNEVIFTFEAEKEDTCQIVLVSRETKERHVIEVPNEYCMGALRSVHVTGLSWNAYDYYYVINGEKVVDPYAKGICGREIWNDSSRKENDYEIFAKFVDDKFAWGEDKKPEITKDKMILYKLHVRGFTKELENQKQQGGTFAGLIKKIPYLKKLGVTSIECMPVYEFEEMYIPKTTNLPEYISWEVEQDDMILPEEIEEEIKKVNYWGYGEGNYFAVKSSYASCTEHANKEFKSLVRALHKNQMECILEMCFPKSINHNLMIDALRFWVKEYHVDGFHLLGESLPLTSIVQDVYLSRTKIMCEKMEQYAYLCHRTYKNLYSYKDEYLYPARKILNHFNGNLGEFLNQQRKQSDELGFVNYITNNNGFTLADLFMYNDRHNEANGEDNTDGITWNFSNNYGVEGPTKKKYIKNLRSLKWRNAILMMLLAQGVPMILSGDEFLNSQEGNNNAYCQDNEIGWINWKNAKRHRKEIAFVQNIISLRKEYPIIAKSSPFTFTDETGVGYPDLSYHGVNAWISQIDSGRMSTGVMYCDKKTKLYVAYNFFSGEAKLALPKLKGKNKWHLLVDSANEEKPCVSFDEANICTRVLEMKPQSICILVGGE